MIQYDEKTNIFKLDTPTTSYVIGLADGKYVGHVYYGKKIKSTDLAYLLRVDEPPFVPSKNMREKVSFVQVLNEPNRRSRRLKLQGLDPGAVYEIGGRQYFGETLMSAGILHARPWGDFKAEIIEVHRVTGTSEQ